MLQSREIDMFIALTYASILKSLKTNAYILLRNMLRHPRTAIGYAIGIVFAIAGSNAYADKFVNNSMSYTDINNEIASATSGEDVHFAEGVYQLPLLVPNSAVFHLGNQGVDLVADGIVTLRGATPTSSASLYITSTKNRVNGFIIEGAERSCFRC